MYADVLVAVPPHYGARVDRLTRWLEGLATLVLLALRVRSSLRKRRGHEGTDSLRQPSGSAVLAAFPASSATRICARPIVPRVGDLGRHRSTCSRCRSRRPARVWTDRVGLALLFAWASNALPDGWLVELARLLLN